MTGPELMERRPNAEVILARALSIAVVITVAVFACGCGGDDAARERREFSALERALGALASAPQEDRFVRFEALRDVAVTTPRVAELKQTCASSYESFFAALDLMRRARAETKTTERRVAALSARVGLGDGGPSAAVIADIRKVSAEAERSLSAVGEELDRAEELVEACERQRRELRLIIRGD